eukprot:gb/GEZN01003832.1/.p1 GENE.gb/GEZN01003832.1/~~gb/GEZN01003832.1/.p1  ORF type:complete len:674 (+),score=113.36 gb/GEZN01003832.1/:41-2062(+)
MPPPPPPDESFEDDDEDDDDLEELPGMSLPGSSQAQGTSALEIASNIFEEAQKNVFSIMRADILPQYLEYRAECDDTDEEGDEQDDVDDPYNVGNVSKEKILEILTEVREKDGYHHLKFQRTLLNNHPLFISDQQLWNHLLSVFNKPVELFDGNKRAAFASQLHVLSILSDWLKRYPVDFVKIGKDVRNTLREWRAALKTQKQILQGQQGPEAAQTYDGVRTLLRQVKVAQEFAETAKSWKKQEKAKSKGLSDDMSPRGSAVSTLLDASEAAAIYAITAPIPNTGDSSGSAPPSPRGERASDSLPNQRANRSFTVTVNGKPAIPQYDISGITAQRLARALTLLDQHQFNQIHPREFVNKAWVRKDAKETSPNILNMVDKFNTRTFWVASEILLRDDASSQVYMIRLFLDTAEQCKSIHNFFMVFAIIAGLNVQPLYRLKDVWHQVPGSYMKKLENLKATVCDSTRNYRAYRRLVKSGLGKAQVPHLAVVTKDCFQLEEIPTFNQDGTINFAKFLRQWNTLGDVLECQEHDYDFEQEPRLFGLIENASREHCLTEDQQWERSYTLLPRKSARTHAASVATSTNSASTSNLKNQNPSLLPLDTRESVGGRDSYPLPLPSPHESAGPRLSEPIAATLAAAVAAPPQPPGKAPTEAEDEASKGQRGRTKSHSHWGMK